LNFCQQLLCQTAAEQRAHKLIFQAIDQLVLEAPRSHRNCFAAPASFGVLRSKINEPG